MNKKSYADSGVDIDANDEATRLISRHARLATRSEVLGGVGFFGGMFELKRYENPVLVSSTDSVGSKLRIAIAQERYDTVGTDIVNHCVNDIFTSGAEPLFFLDYIGIGRMIPEKVADIVLGVAKACQEVGCALIGGETAELGDMYAGDDYDLVGFVVGVVEKEKIIDGRTIMAGDAIIGLPSSGVHTNGYTLVRNIFGEARDELGKDYPELGRTMGEELLEPHRCYYNQLKPLLPVIKGMAHITGGGLIDNVPRILPQGLAAQFHLGKWTILPIFQLIQYKGNVDRQEMYRVFNMGIGIALVCSPDNAGQLIRALPGASVVGEVVEQRGGERVVIN
ncbi:MAG: phosphoribosylformylglycinamidine cyclo-ligase [Dehalococcoidales bacterium]|jgi:phosphoribosylformylglycinamidine cyclo-ligase|nr:phosphoribosylformylglycinamidine cyclo-ligase [Dehalococcoidales bacterium]MDP6127803.1 phosphoribosylformylglycinamidine cyclo-ligase [Dehalococcoidales bacterium]MDP6501908.1 phosphoribosylformylglycinamidine cyclo-ligase [Dehalococcoidales bacterium]